jgi:hypothetical protein
MILGKRGVPLHEVPQWLIDMLITVDDAGLQSLITRFTTERAAVQQHREDPAHADRAAGITEILDALVQERDRRKHQ